MRILLALSIFLIGPLCLASSLQKSNLQFQGKVLRIAVDELREFFLVKFDVLDSEYKIAAVTDGPLYECIDRSLKTATPVSFSFEADTSRIQSCE